MIFKKNLMTNISNDFECWLDNEADVSDADGESMAQVTYERAEKLRRLRSYILNFWSDDSEFAYAFAGMLEEAETYMAKQAKELHDSYDFYTLNNNWHWTGVTSNDPNGRWERVQ